MMRLASISLTAPRSSARSAEPERARISPGGTARRRCCRTRAPPCRASCVRAGGRGRVDHRARSSCGRSRRTGCGPMSCEQPRAGARLELVPAHVRHARVGGKAPHRAREEAEAAHAPAPPRSPRTAPAGRGRCRGTARPRGCAPAAVRAPRSSSSARSIWPKWPTPGRMIFGGRPQAGGIAHQRSRAPISASVFSTERRLPAP